MVWERVLTLLAEAGPGVGHFAQLGDVGGREVPTTRGAGVCTPSYCFAWPFRWSGISLFATSGSATPKAAVRNGVAAPRVAGSSGRTVFMPVLGKSWAGG